MMKTTLNLKCDWVVDGGGGCEATAKVRDDDEGAAARDLMLMDGWREAPRMAVPGERRDGPRKVFCPHHAKVFTDNGGIL